jgi:uncharacterized repeat protein (TIGR02543 family)
MNANANNITYERRPVNVNTASGVNPPTLATPAARITFNPADGATNVPRGTAITITFDSAMTLQNGNAITSANITDFVNLRRGSATGAHVSFTATINSARTVITIIPDSQLHNNTTYHLNIPANRIRDANGESNTAQNISFSTGTASAFVSFTPGQGALIAPTARDLTVVFSEAIQTNTGATVTLDWLRNNNVFILRTGTTATGGSAVGFTVQSWNANNRTAVIRATSNFSHGDFYFGVAANRLRTTANHTPIPATGITFTVGDGHTISFNANGGTGTMNPNPATVNRNSNFTVPSNTFNAPSGRVFHNWNTQSNGQGNAFAPGSVMSNVTQNWTLFAQWGHSVTFVPNAGGATVGGMPSNTTVMRNASYSVPNVTPTRTGHTFRGWHTAADLPSGTVAIQPNGLVSNNVTAHIRLYAIWEVATAAPPVITTHPQNQSVSEGSNVTFTVAATGIPGPTFTWQVSTDGGASWGSAGVTGPTLTLSNVTLAMNDNRYRAVATNASGSIASNAAILTVTPVAAPPTITSVIVSAPSSSVAQGSTMQFGVTVDGTPPGGFPTGVTWTVTGGTASSITSGGGSLTVGAEETVGTVLTVRATSNHDLTQFGEVTVTVTNPSGGGNGGDGGDGGDGGE